MNNNDHFPDSAVEKKGRAHENCANFDVTCKCIALLKIYKLVNQFSPQCKICFNIKKKASLFTFLHDCLKRLQYKVALASIS